ncbi:MAG: DUF1540 domain-containing protein [Planctomycetes bacterium]|nr:DUF1540 domain-containing protein [Planctomycetota bacterium]
MECSRVKKCEVADCAYNASEICHAIAVTIGDSSNPKCDTYCLSAVQGGDIECMANVGACKVAACKFNMSLECQADEICVGYKENEPDCLTFQLS